MFDIEILRGYYKGAGIKVALIDAGIKKEEDDSIYNIKRYFYDYSNACMKTSKENNIYSEHGSTCGKYILNIAPQINLMDINVENSISEISEDAVCSAIEFAVGNGCDIINMSLGFHAYSEKLYLACEEAYKKNVIIIAAAAHKNTLIFPADFDDFTIKIVDEDISKENENEKITKISDRLYQVYLKPFHEYSYDKKTNITTTTVSMGSSIACAYFTAILALYLESRPLIKKAEVVDSLFGKRNANNISQIQDMESEFKIDEKSIFSIISSYYNYAEYKEIINKNISGYYDLLNQKTTFFGDENINTANLYVVNPLHYQRTKLNNENFKKINYLGDFKDINCYCGKPLLKSYSTSVKDIETPIILISGVGTDCGKLNVQLELKKQMIKNDFHNYCITYNPLGYIFDMDFMKYPDDLPFHDLIYSLNSYIKKIEDDVDYESIIINVAGGMFPLSRIKTNKFGMLYNAYLNALSIDYIIICTNSIIDVSVIKDEIERLKWLGNTDVAVVISNLSYSELSLTTSARNNPHIENNENIEHCIEEYKNHLGNVPVFNFKDVVNGLLYNDIIEKMT